MKKNRYQTIGMAIVISFFLCLTGWAQEDTGSPPTASLMHIDGETHVLRPGDEIELHIDSLPELEKAYTVRVDGRFSHPLVGEVSASGRTLKELRKEIKVKLSKELRHPSFRVGILRVAQHKVAVLGEAQRQGTFEVGAGATVLDLIAAAGGLGPKADRDKAMLLRGEEKLSVSLRPEAGEGLTKVRTGDVLYILTGSPVSVTGEVTKPGVYSVSRVRGGPRQAILAAGGALEQASLSRVRLIRATEPKPIVLDLRPDTTTELPEAVRQLQEGDILVVPARQAVLLGAVGQAGPVPLRGGETLFDIISSRINATNSDIERIMVVRSKDVLAQREEKEEYNLREYFEDGKADIAVPIYDGDLIYVPTKSDGGGIFGNLNGILGIINLARFFF